MTRQKTGGIEGKVGGQIPKISERAYQEIIAYNSTAETAGGPSYPGNRETNWFYN